MQHRIEKRDIGARLERQMQVGGARGDGGARVDDDELETWVTCPRLLDAPVDDGVGEGGIRAGDQDQVGVVDVLVGAGWRIRPKRLLVARYCRGHAQSRVGVDVVRADQALGKFVEDVVVLGEQLSGDVERHGVRAVRGDDLPELFRDMVQRLAPGFSLVVDLGIKQARAGVGGQVQRRALGAQAPVICRVRGVAFHGKDSVLVR